MSLLQNPDNPIACKQQRTLGTKGLESVTIERISDVHVEPDALQAHLPSHSTPSDHAAPVIDLRDGVERRSSQRTAAPGRMIDPIGPYARRALVSDIIAIAAAVMTAVIGRFAVGVPVNGTVWLYTGIGLLFGVAWLTIRLTVLLAVW